MKLFSIFTLNLLSTGFLMGCGSEEVSCGPSFQNNIPIESTSCNPIILGEGEGSTDRPNLRE